MFDLKFGESNENRFEKQEVEYPLIPECVIGEENKVVEIGKGGKVRRDKEEEL